MKVLNNFLIVEFIDDSDDDNVMQYSGNGWNNDLRLRIASVITVGDSVTSLRKKLTDDAFDKKIEYHKLLVDESKIICNIGLNRALISTDSIVACYDLENHMPLANNDEIVMQLDDPTNWIDNAYDLAYSSVVTMNSANTFIGKIVDGISAVLMLKYCNSKCISVVVKNDMTALNDVYPIKLSSNYGQFVIVKEKHISMILED